MRSGRLRRRLGACLIAVGLLFVSFEGVRRISDRRVRDAYVETPTTTVSDSSSASFIISGALILAGIACVIKGQR